MTLVQIGKVRTCGLLLSLLSFALLCVAPASAIEFGFSPSEIYLSAYEKCRDVEVYSNRPITIDIQEKWSEKASRDVRDYTDLNGSFLSHPAAISVRRNALFEVCLDSEIVPSSNALLMLNIRNSSFSGGIWVHLSQLRETGVNVKAPEGNLNTKISGFFTLSNDRIEFKQSKLFILGMFELLLLEMGILGILFALIHRKKHRS